MKAPYTFRIVSFDIFDTLIHRSVARPTDLFRVMEAQGSPVPEGFACKRMEAERAASIKYGRPVTLREIYAEFATECSVQVESLMEIEQALELAGCRPNSKWVSLFNRYLSAGKKVILISDMYLPRETITQMLDRCGVRGYDKLYISCEAGASKAEGTLFDTVLKEYCIKPWELLHIGDNRKSDFLVPLLKGIRVHPAFRKEERFTGTPKEYNEKDLLAHRTIQVLLRDIASDLDSIERLGCETFGPLLAGFSQWLLRRFRQDGIHDVYFMARDGYMMKQAFDVICPPDIHTHYLYCSRRSYTVPLLWQHSAFDDIFDNITIQKRMTLRSFLLRIGLDAQQYVSKAASFGVGLDDVFEHDSFRQSKQVAQFYETIREDVVCQSRQEYNALRQYILSCDMPQQVAVVDIGYHGTMQNALVQLLTGIGLNNQVKGYYVCVDPDASLIINQTIQAVGYLCDQCHDKEMFIARTKFSPIFETIFLAPHGSVRRFIMCDGQAKPELYEYEYDDDAERIVDEKLCVQAYQRGALKFIHYLKDSFPKGWMEISPQVAMQRMIQMGTCPTVKEAEYWGDIRFLDHEKSLIAHPEGWGYYFRHPRKLMHDYMQCGWKIGFMRRLFRVPLPYHGIYMFLRERFNNGKRRP